MAPTVRPETQNAIGAANASVAAAVEALTTDIAAFDAKVAAVMNPNHDFTELQAQYQTLAQIIHNFNAQIKTRISALDGSLKNVHDRLHQKIQEKANLEAAQRQALEQQRSQTFWRRVRYAGVTAVGTGLAALYKFGPDCAKITAAKAAASEVTKNAAKKVAAEAAEATKKSVAKAAAEAAEAAKKSVAEAVAKALAEEAAKAPTGIASWITGNSVPSTATNAVVEAAKNAASKAAAEATAKAATEAAAKAASSAIPNITANATSSILPSAANATADGSILVNAYCDATAHASNTAQWMLSEASNHANSAYSGIKDWGSSWANYGLSKASENLSWGWNGIKDNASGAAGWVLDGATQVKENINGMTGWVSHAWKQAGQTTLVDARVLLIGAGLITSGLIAFGAYKCIKARKQAALAVRVNPLPHAAVAAAAGPGAGVVVNMAIAAPQAAPAAALAAAPVGAGPAAAPAAAP